MADTQQNSVTTLDDYLAGRKLLIASREVLFIATRMFLRPGQRPDAQLLGDRLWDAPARRISDDEWVSNAALGYLVILENADKGRSFRLCVTQQGRELQVGVQLPAWYSDASLPSVSRLLATFGPHSPVTTPLVTDELLVSWHFPAEHLYTDAQAIEDGVRRIGAVFEAAIQAFTPLKKSAP